MSATVITGVIGSDCHIIGSRLLSIGLEKAGFKVVSLGSAVSQEELINAAIETNAAAILVSSIYGQAAIDCEGLRDKCDEAGLKNILLYLGGNLAIGKEDWGELEKTFIAMGFSRVYPPKTLPAVASADLKKDLGLE